MKPNTVFREVSVVGISSQSASQRERHFCVVWGPSSNRAPKCSPEVPPILTASWKKSPIDSSRLFSERRTSDRCRSLGNSTWALSCVRWMGRRGVICLYWTSMRLMRGRTWNSLRGVWKLRRNSCWSLLKRRCHQGRRLCWSSTNGFSPTTACVCNSQRTSWTSVQKDPQSEYA